MISQLVLVEKVSISISTNGATDKEGEIHRVCRRTETPSRDIYSLTHAGTETVREHIYL